MIYRWLADIVVLVHFSFILFVVLGALLAFKWPRVLYAQIPAALWGASIEFSHGVCPLTPLENGLRHAAGATGYEESFIEHYLAPLIYPSGLTPDIAFWLGVAVVAINVTVYAGLAVIHWWPIGAGRK